MRNVVLDTNVLVSALIQRSYPNLIVDSIFARPDVQVCISDELLAEYVDVLNRSKFSRFPDFERKAQALLADIHLRAIHFTPTVKLDVIGDVDDNKLLELAETCEAEYLVTGNTNDFTMQWYGSTRILTPKEFWETVLA